MKKSNNIITDWLEKYGDPEIDKQVEEEIKYINRMEKEKSKMKKYRIELSEQQMRLIADCLEDVSRFASGQWEMRYTIEEMLRGLPFDEQMKRLGEVGELLKKAKRVLLPDLTDNASKGYNGTDFIGNTYQIYRTILHQLAKDNDWDNVYSSPALPSGNLGTIKIEAVGVT